MQKMKSSSVQTVSFWFQETRYFSLSDDLVLSLPAFLCDEEDLQTREEKIKAFVNTLHIHGIHRLISASTKTFSTSFENLTPLSLEFFLFFKNELAKRGIALVVEAKQNRREEMLSPDFLTKLQKNMPLFDALFFRQLERQAEQKGAQIGSLTCSTEYEKTSAELRFLEQYASCDFFYCLETKDLFHAERQAKWLLQLAKESAPSVTLAFDGVISSSDTQVVHPFCDGLALQKIQNSLTLCPSVTLDSLWQLDSFSHLINILPSQNVTSFLFKGSILPRSGGFEELLFAAVLRKISSKTSLDVCLEKELIERCQIESGAARKARALLLALLNLTRSQRQYSQKKNEKTSKKHEACKILIEDHLHELRSLLSNSLVDNSIQAFSQL
jgi:hypothetical protein